MYVLAIGLIALLINAFVATPVPVGTILLIIGIVLSVVGGLELVGDLIHHRRPPPPYNRPPPYLRPPS